MGLERAAAVMQGVHSNYDIDLFRNLIKAAAQATHAKDASSPSLRVIADHIRACSFLIVDGVIRGMKGAATCCAASSGARSATATSSDKRSRSSHAGEGARGRDG